MNEMLQLVNVILRFIANKFIVGLIDIARLSLKVLIGRDFYTLVRNFLFLSSINVGSHRSIVYCKLSSFSKDRITSIAGIEHITLNNEYRWYRTHNTKLIYIL